MQITAFILSCINVKLLYYGRIFLLIFQRIDWAKSFTTTRPMEWAPVTK